MLQRVVVGAPPPLRDLLDRDEAAGMWPLAHDRRRVAATRNNRRRKTADAKSLIDIKGLGKPGMFDSTDARKFPHWKFKFQNFA